MNNNPLVSVIIPVFNDGIYLAESVKSALEQTYANIEILVVNDGSTDEFTLSVLRNIEQAKVRVIHKENGHLSSARNAGIQQAKGEFILTLDADDKFHKKFLELALPNFKDANIGVVSCYVKAFGDRSYKWKPRGGNALNFLFRNECCGNSLFRRKVWEEAGGFDEQMKSGYEDWEFWIRVTKSGWVVKVLRQYLFNYRITAKSMLLSSSEPKRREIVSYIVNKHKEYYYESLVDAIAAWRIIDKGKSAQWVDILSLLKRKI
ncbi:MAG TPA: glycosyltransferase family A protein [Chitinophagaceae bacterium]|nr:glycosyltransferase family A protein [Chitinophagaceae bacterium]